MQCCILSHPTPRRDPAALGKDKNNAPLALLHHILLFSVWRISAAPLQYYSFESALVFVLSVYTDARSVDRRTVRPHHCASTEQLKDCSYLRNSFNTLYEWPISLLKPCYIALQLMSEHACIPPSSPFACVSHTYILVHSIHFSLSYISANKYADTHVHPLPDYCSPSGKRCALLFHSRVSKSIFQRSLMADV